MNQLAPSRLEPLSPSCKGIYQALENADGALTLHEIKQKTYLKDRTARWALDNLIEEGLVECRPNPTDARQKLYSLK